MKIVSKFHDYYDSVQRYGYDDVSTVFIREIKEFEIPSRGKQKNNFISELVTIFDVDSGKPKQKLKNKQRLFPYFSSYHGMFIEGQKLHPILILFCGKVYKCLKFEYRSYHPKTYYFYTKEEALSFYKKHYPKVFSEKREKSLSYALNNYFSIPFEGKEAKNKQFIISNKISIALFSHEHNRITINDSLKDIEFYRVVDPFSAFQELDMWTSGVLASPPNFMVEIEDKYRIESHGFDTKYGFRKRPGSYE